MQKCLSCLCNIERSSPSQSYGERSLLSPRLRRAKVFSGLVRRSSPKPDADTLKLPEQHRAKLAFAKATASEGGERGIRTLDTLRYTRFPGVPVQPLLHLSEK